MSEYVRLAKCVLDELMVRVEPVEFVQGADGDFKLCGTCLRKHIGLGTGDKQRVRLPQGGLDGVVDDTFDARPEPGPATRGRC